MRMRSFISYNKNYLEATLNGIVLGNNIKSATEIDAQDGHQGPSNDHRATNIVPAPWNSRFDPVGSP